MIPVGKTSLTGSAGEHLVMSRLLSRGLIAALAPQGVPNMDIVVTSTDGSILCAIQVKSRWEKGADGGWHMGEKHEEIHSDQMFYCFVNLGNDITFSPTVHVIPSRIVADAIRINHATWMATPGKGGRKRRNSNVRRLVPDYTRYAGEKTPNPQGWMERYFEAWDLLKAPPQNQSS